MAKRPVINIECHDLIEYQLLPCAFLLLMDKVGLAVEQTAKEHHEQLDVFLSEWAGFTPEHQTRFLNRLANIMKHGAALELEHVSLLNYARANAVRDLHTPRVNVQN